jgi:peptide/nickel transport system substrate-binding protein
LILRTQAYQALDEVTVEWRGVPGYRFAGYVASFFFPLPRHAWGALSPQDLLSAEQAVRKPLGWGPYVVDEWTSGDHISLSRNPIYFRASEGLPRFERLVFRFVDGPEQALAALLAGECDYLDESTRLDPQDAAVVEASAAGKLSLFQQAGSAWEHLDFGILSLNSALPAVFSSREVRQAVASCTDRQRIVSEVLAGQAALAESYIPPEHPLFNAELRRYSFDPNAGKALLESAGWVDADGDPATPRRSSAVAGIADDTPLELSLAITDESEKQRIGALLQESLAQCGIKLNLESLPAETLYASGPQGVIFGRNFSLAQFAWMRSLEPPCFLYTTQEIPGTYPQYPKGWGGANVSGYSNLDFDRTCWRALSTLPEQPEHKAAHQLAQAIFMEDLPALPLYYHSQTFAPRPGLCGIIQDASADTPLWNLEHFDYGGACPK